MLALSPLALDRGDGLIAALRAIIRRIGPDRVTVREEGCPRPLALEVEGELLGIAREAIANALHHAGDVAHIHAWLRFRELEVELEIIDDGVGFDFETGRELVGHFGLWTMSERAARIGAIFTMTSSPGSGTQVLVCLADPSGAPVADVSRADGEGG